MASTSSHNETAQSKSDILLEAGTNEVEIFEFNIGGHRYGVNVAKVNQIVRRDQVTITRTDLPPPGVLGSITYRGKPTMTIDLREILGLESNEIDNSRALMLVTQFNDQTVAFAIDGAERIHRVSWKKFEPISSTFSEENPFVNGIIRMENHLVLVLDLEYILTTINPNLGIKAANEQLERIESEYKPREEIRILFAEDSAMIRKMIASQLTAVGFTNVDLATNGKEALDKITSYKEQAEKNGQPLSDYVDLILTDIEMPIMDGLAFCKCVKKDLELDVPVIVFSSLINEQMIRKCQSVGADDWGTKPKVNLVIDLIDRYVVHKKQAELQPAG